jgi:hypothetical protein
MEDNKRHDSLALETIDKTITQILALLDSTGGASSQHQPNYQHFQTVETKFFFHN